MGRRHILGVVEGRSVRSIDVKDRLRRLMEVPILHSDHPLLATARFSWTQVGIDYLVPSELMGSEASMRGWKRRLRAARARWGALRFKRLVVCSPSFPMGYTRLHEPLSWFHLSEEHPATIACQNRLKPAWCGNYKWTGAVYCERPIPLGDDLSCAYCGRALCHICQTENAVGGDAPVCRHCVESITTWDLEHIP